MKVEVEEEAEVGRDRGDRKGKGGDREEGKKRGREQIKE